MYKFSKMLVRNMNTTRKPLVLLSKIVRKQQDEALLKPYSHIQKALCESHIDILLSFNDWLPVPEDKARAVEEFMRTFHLVIILLDDIIDNSPVRWNVPAAHAIYSSALSINSACHAMSMGLKRLTDLEPKAQGLIFESVTDFYRGQGIEIYWRDNATCPSEEEYIDMIHQKASNVLHLSCQLRQLFSQDQTDYLKLTTLLGEYYQIRNDYYNLVDEQYEGNRAVCGDITEGKFTLPIIHAVKHSDVGSEVINILRQRTEDINLKKYCLSLLEDVGSFQYTRDKLLKIETEIYNEVDGVKRTYYEPAIAHGPAAVVQCKRRSTTTPVPLQKIDRIQEDEKVLKPFIHIYKANRKFLRELYRSFNYWLKVHDDKRRDIEDCIQTYHSASLMIDDIQDNSTFRYQVPVAHVVYSLALTINAAGHGLVLALEKLVALEPKAIGIFIEVLIDTYRGQGIDIYWRDNLVCPSEEEYIDMISQKTAMLFILAYRLHQLFSHDKTDYTKLANLIGIYYQIRDDYCNLFAQKHTDNKTYCSDITEGKFSLPIIHALKHSDNAGEIINILKLRTQDPDLKRYCVSLLEEVGSFRYTREMLRKLESDIYNEVNRLGGNPELVTVMEKLGDWRTYSKA